MPDQPRHRPVANPDGTFTWCATCIDPTCDQLHEQWPCAVRRLTDSLAADGTIVPQDVAERATAAAVSSHAAALRSAEAVNQDLARQLDACAAADDDVLRQRLPGWGPVDRTGQPGAAVAVDALTYLGTADRRAWATMLLGAAAVAVGLSAVVAEVLERRRT